MNGLLHSLRLAYAVSPFLFAAGIAQADVDLLIRNARVIDGTGSPWFVSDVAVEDGRIHAIGNLTFRIHCDPTHARLTATTWSLPGLTLSVAHDARTFEVRPVQDGFEVRFIAATQVEFTVPQP